MTCLRCTAKDTYIRELEAALKGAVWPDTTGAPLIRSALGVTAQQSSLIATLHAARENYVSVESLQMSLPSSRVKGEDRSPHFPVVVISYVRKALGSDFIDTFSDRAGSLGFRLSAKARRRVDQILKEREA